LFVTETFHWTTTGAGLIFLALYVPTGFGAIMGKWVDARGPRVPATLGFLLSTTALISISFVSYNSTPQKVLLIVFLGLVGFCTAMLEVAFMAEVCQIVASVEEKSPGIFGEAGAMAKGYGLFNIAFSAGQLGGPLLSGFLKDSAGWSVMTITFGVMSLTAAVPVVLWTGGWIGDIKKDKMRRGALSTVSTGQDETV
jgi:MFS family permease